MIKAKPVKYLLIKKYEYSYHLAKVFSSKDALLTYILENQISEDEYAFEVTDGKEVAIKKEASIV